MMNLVPCPCNEDTHQRTDEAEGAIGYLIGWIVLYHLFIVQRNAKVIQFGE